MRDRIEVERLIAVAKRIGLHGVEDVEQHPIGCLCADYNGIGPEFFPERLRRAIDSLAEDLQPAAMIHDFRWSHADGSEDDFNFSNTELEVNFSLIAKSFPVYHPKRYYLAYVGKKFAYLCRAYGYIPYVLACKNNKGTEQ